MQTIQKIALKVVNAFLIVVGLVFFLIYMVLQGLIMLVIFPIFIVLDFKEFVKDPLCFIKTMFIELEGL